MNSLPAADSALSVPAPAPGALAEEARRLLSAPDDLVHMDCGLDGPALLGVPDAPLAESTFSAVRAAIAPAFGCDGDELVVTHNTTDALCKVLAGLVFREGDEIVITSQEHHTVLAATALARDRHGVRIRVVDLPFGDGLCAEAIVGRFAAALGARTRLLLFSAPTYTTGTLLPIRMLAELAQDRGVLTLVDAAHLPGMLRLDCHALGIDFLAGSGRKWQYGPAETGLLYIRNKVLAEGNRLPLPDFWPVVSLWYPPQGGLPPRSRTATASYDIGDYLQTTGSASRARLEGLQKACATWDAIGRDRIECHLLDLSADLKRKLAERFGPQAVLSPLSDTRLSSALTTFTPFPRPDDDPAGVRLSAFLQRLERRHRIRLRHIELSRPGGAPALHALRCAVRVHHTHDDVDRLVTAAAAVRDELGNGRS